MGWIADQSRSIDLVSYAINELGFNLERDHGSYATFFCPFHSEQTSGSFWIYRNDDAWGDKWVDFHSGASGDIHQLLVSLGKANTFIEAAQLIKEGGNKPVNYTTAPRKERKIESPSFAEVQHYAKNIKIASAYLKERGICNLSITERFFGVNTDWHWTREINGKPFESECYRLVIPEIRVINGKPVVITFNERILPQSARIFCNEHPKVVEYYNKLYLEKKGKLPSEVKLHEMIFGPKYFRKGPQAIYGVQPLLEENGKLKDEFKLPIIITESEMSAEGLRSYLDDEGGYISMGCKPVNSINIAGVFTEKRTPNVYIAYDDDEPGWEMASRLRKLIPHAVVIKMLDGFNDPNDITVARQTEEWLEPFGIEPVERKLLALPAWS